MMMQHGTMHMNGACDSQHGVRTSVEYTRKPPKALSEQFKTIIDTTSMSSWGGT